MEVTTRPPGLPILGFKQVHIWLPVIIQGYMRFVSFLSNTKVQIVPNMQELLCLRIIMLKQINQRCKTVFVKIFWPLLFYRFHFKSLLRKQFYVVILGYLVNLIVDEGGSSGTSIEYEIANDIKARVCYVAPDPSTEVADPATYTLPSGQFS